jgi:hypothetical protein
VPDFVHRIEIVTILHSPFYNLETCYYLSSSPSLTFLEENADYDLATCIAAPPDPPEAEPIYKLQNKGRGVVGQLLKVMRNSRKRRELTRTS